MLFNYKAIKDNKVIYNKIEAENEQMVLNYLRTHDFFPIEIKEGKTAQLTSFTSMLERITFNDIVDFTRQLAIMLNAGLTIVESLDILQKQIAKEKLKALIDHIDKEIKAGSSLSAVLRNYPQYFSNLYIALVKSGEASGKLSEILLKLAENLEKQREFRSKLRGAMIYPAVIISAMFIVMFIMITFVLPKMLDLYKSFDVELPITTKFLIVISSFSVKFWPFIIAVVMGGIFLLQRYLKTDQGRKIVDSLLFRLPMVSDIVKKAALVDSTRTLAILTGAGVSILDGLNIVIDTTSNSIFKEAFQNVFKKVEKGQSLGNALSLEGIFPPIFVQMVIVGENTGHLDDTLLRLSRYFEFESENVLKAATTLIEPIVLVVLGVGVAFLVLSVITPIYKLTESFNR